jgi:hypothetical protein
MPFVKHADRGFVRTLKVAPLLLALSVLSGCAAQVSLSPPTAAPSGTANTRSNLTPGMSWQWQLTGKVDIDVEAQVFDIDLFNTDASIVSALHARGRTVICYLDAGAWEPFRPDSSKFPAGIRGNVYPGFPDERWLDIRRLDILGPILKARLDLCKAKGFDGVEFDNIDGYAANTGFPLTGPDQLKFNRFLSAEAHARGLLAGLKNDLDQVASLVSSFDFSINEECFEHHECETLLPFIRAGKPVFNAEYHLEPAAYCAKARELRISSIRKHRDLDAWRSPC